ncbi:AdoMet-homocysteine methyltransferase [Coniothyrium glycines]
MAHNTTRSSGANINKISTYLSLGQPIFLDGALATYLETLGADVSGALWSADVLIRDAQLIKRAHLDYYRAGANVAITASYQASVPGIVKYMDTSEFQAKDLIKRSVKLARDARDEYITEYMASLGEVELATASRNGASLEWFEDDLRGKLFVAGSVGPYGAYLADGSEYRGDYSLSDAAMKDFHRGRIQALVEAGADILACETIPSKAEIVALLDLLSTEFPTTEAWFSFTLRDSQHISDGTPLGDIAALFENNGQVIAVGLNCVPDDLGLAALNELRLQLKSRTMVFYPNSGEQWNAQAREWEGERSEGSTLAEKTTEWWHAGAIMVGGCCRTTPDDIRTMKKALRPFY